MDISTVIVSAATAIVTSTITAYWTSKLKIFEEREKWMRELAQKHAEVEGANPEIAANLAKQFAIALIVVTQLKGDGPPTDRSKFFVLPNTRMVAGRNPTSAIVLRDVEVSRQQLAFSSNMQYVFVEYLGAKKGIFLNGNQIQETVRLKNGDVVKTGNTTFEVLMLRE